LPLKISTDIDPIEEASYWADTGRLVANTVLS
jgi:hypothetical protein